MTCARILMISFARYSIATFAITSHNGEHGAHCKRGQARQRRRYKPISRECVGHGIKRRCPWRKMRWANSSEISMPDEIRGVDYKEKASFPTARCEHSTQDLNTWPQTRWFMLRSPDCGILIKCVIYRPLTECAKGAIWMQPFGVSSCVMDGSLQCSFDTT
jgi:hypothetical protein